MGTLATFECKACGYSAHVAGGREICMTMDLLTISCPDCRALSVVQVASSMPDHIRIVGEEEEELDLRCPKCSRPCRAWESDHPCPKCGGSMDAGYGMITCVD